MALITQPTNCPVCDSVLVTVKDQLFCKNSSCSAQVSKKIEHFAKVMKLKGLGPATVQKLDISSFTDLYKLSENDLNSLVGKTTGTKLKVLIDDSVYTDFATVLEAMAIPMIGGTASKKIASNAENFDQITEESCKNAGLGNKATQSLLYWLDTEYQEIKNSLPFKFKKREENKAVSNGQVICITGKLKSFATKKEAAVALEAKGYEVTDNLNKTVTFLVDEDNKRSSKRVKAESMGITIVTDLNLFLT